MEYPEDHTCIRARAYTHTHTQLLELMSEFSRVVVYKVYSHKSVAFLHMSSEQFEKEITK